MRKNKPEKEKKDLKIPISEPKKPEKELKIPIFEPKKAENTFKFTFKLSILSALDMKDRISVAEWNDLHITASPDGMKWVNMTHELYEYSVCVGDTVKINALQEAYRQLPEHPYQYPPYVLFKGWVDAGKKDPKPNTTHEVWLGASKKEKGTILPEEIDPGRRDTTMKSILLSRIGSRICDERKKKSMTQEGLANALGTTQAVISRMEKGSHDMSSADLYGISIYFIKPLQYFTDEFPAPVGENVWIMGKEKKFFHRYRIIGCSPEDTAYRSLFVVPVISTPYIVFESWGEETRDHIELNYDEIGCIPLSGLSLSKSNPGDYVLNVEIEIPISIHTIGSGDPSLN